MALWKIEFYPPSGDRYSPSSYIKSLSNKGDVAVIRIHLRAITELQPWDWPSSKLIAKDIYQVTAGNHRIYFGIDGNRLIVCHICRKVRQKARVEDIERARTNFKEYLRSKQL